MEVLDVQMAIHAYRQLGDAGMVMGLERIAYVEDKNLLAGHVALLFGNYQTAQVEYRRCILVVGVPHLTLPRFVVFFQTLDNLPN